MNREFKITATIVLYKEHIETLTKTVNSFLLSPLKKKLFLVDNSPTNLLEKHFKSSEIAYIFVGKNIGFGKAHNLIINKIKDLSEYHLVLNPDVEFDKNTISILISNFQNAKEIAMISPKVVYPNKENQYTCRAYPTIFDLINRRLHIFPKQLFNKEYRNLDLTQPFYPDFIHGCFMLFKTQEFVKLKGFDERYFLYMEDVDMCKKIDEIGKKKLYFPEVTITHQHQKESSKKIRLLIHHISSAIKYFLKWGV